MHAVRVEGGDERPSAPDGVVTTGVAWLATGVEIILVGLAVPIGILVVGLPVALVVRAVIEIAARW